MSRILIALALLAACLFLATFVPAAEPAEETTWRPGDLVVVRAYCLTPELTQCAIDGSARGPMPIAAILMVRERVHDEGSSVWAARLDYGRAGYVVVPDGMGRHEELTGL